MLIYDPNIKCVFEWKIFCFLSWHIFQPNIQTSYQVLADFYYSSLGYIMLSLIFKTKLDLELQF
jgi:hypothetical protein